MNSKLLLTSLAIVLSVAILSYIGLFTNLTGKDIYNGLDYRCSDSDSNPSIDVQIMEQGFVEGKGSNGQEFKEWDFCSSDPEDKNEWVIEYTCEPYSASGYKRHKLFCENGCSNGRCL